MRAMIALGLVVTADIATHFERLKPMLSRYPAVDADAFERNIGAFVASAEHR